MRAVGRQDEIDPLVESFDPADAVTFQVHGLEQAGAGQPPPTREGSRREHVDVPPVRAYSYLPRLRETLDRRAGRPWVGHRRQSVADACRHGGLCKDGEPEQRDGSDPATHERPPGSPACRSPAGASREARRRLVGSSRKIVATVPRSDPGASGCGRHRMTRLRGENPSAGSTPRARRARRWSFFEEWGPWNSSPGRPAHAASSNRPASSAPPGTVPAQRLQSWCHIRWCRWCRWLRSTARHAKSASCFTAPVAQLDRASGFEPAGRPFESGRARS